MKNNTVMIVSSTVEFEDGLYGCVMLGPFENNNENDAVLSAWADAALEAVKEHMAECGLNPTGKHQLN